MRPARISTFRLDKPFEKLAPSHRFAEVAFRLVANFYSGTPHVVGTATVLSGHLLITARHVLEDLWELRVDGVAPYHEIQSLSAIQILPGPEYVIWDVVGGWTDPSSDLALLHLGANPGKSSHTSQLHAWKVLRINPFPPEVGERIAAFGYHSSRITASRNTGGGNHIALDDEAVISVGIVKSIYEFKRDTTLLPFPCYEVSARFEGGMSGGAVFDETGSLCGVICSSFPGLHLDGDPVSHVTSLWPIFRLVISADRGDRFARGVEYPVIELARGGQIAVPDLSRLERWFAQHTNPRLQG